MEPSEELIIRQGKERGDACRLIREMGEDLEMPTACSSAALVIYHAYRQQKQDNTPTLNSKKVQVEWWTVECSACILVAAKVNEVPRKVRDVVNVAHQRIYPGSEALQVGATFWELRDALVACEQDVLRTLGFCIQPPLPFNYLLNYLKALNATPMLSGAAFAILNESFDLPLCLHFEPHVIAAACIHVAAGLLNFPLPRSEDEEGRSVEWHEVVAVPSTILQLVGGLVMSQMEEAGSKAEAPPDTAAAEAAESLKLKAWLRSLQ